MPHRDRLRKGDVVEVTLRFIVNDVEHLGPSLWVPPGFTALTFAHGEPRPDGGGNIFTIELPDGVGEVKLLGVGG